MRSAFDRVVGTLAVLGTVVMLLASVLSCTTITGPSDSPSAPPEPSEPPPGPESTPAPVLEPTSTSPPIEPSPTVRAPDVDFEGVSFSVDPSVANGFAAEIIAAYVGSPGDPMWMFNPEYREITLMGYAHMESDFVANVSVYPVAEYAAMVPYINDMVSEMRVLLAERPMSADNVPFLPVYNAAQLMRANIKYLDFQNGSGVRFLTQYGQAAWPINNQNLFYTFQGLSEDDRFWISVILPVSHPALSPDGEDIPGGDYPAFADGFMDYVLDMTALLDSQADSSFMPDLLLLDEMIQSLLVR